MSNEEAEAIESYYKSSDAAKERHSFINRMERKLHQKERFGRAI